MSISNQQVLSLIVRIETRIGVADDSQLESQLTTVLPQLLQLLLFNDETVRNKLLQVLGYINRRIKDSEQVKLPLKPILDLYFSPAAENSPFLKNFSLIFLNIAFKRSTDNVSFFYFYFFCTNQKSKKIN